MNLQDLLKLSLNNLLNRKLRSWLTIIGIIIGVAAVVTLVSIGQGIQASIQSQLSVLGGNIVFVSPGSSKATGFGSFSASGGFISGGQRPGNITQNDLHLIESAPGVASVDGIISERSTVRYVNEAAAIGVQGVDPDIWKDFVTTTLSQGRYLTRGDTFSAVLGYEPANTLFKNHVALNSVISIDGQNFRVVGILQQSGNSNVDNLVVIPIEATRRIFTDIPNNQFSAIVVKTTDNNNVQDVVDSITTKLLASHHVTADTKDFTVISAQAISQTINQVIGTFTFFLGSIAAISLLVGGIGIANTMFMSVVERTRQIGIMKALGATNGDVMKLFMVESALIGLVGGVIGVLIGYVASQAISAVGSGFGSGNSTTDVTPQIIIFMLLFSVTVGILSGVFPARQAARLDPVEALSYE